jgi:hypothetical protein
MTGAPDAPDAPDVLGEAELAMQPGVGSSAPGALAAAPPTSAEGAALLAPRVLSESYRIDAGSEAAEPMIADDYDDDAGVDESDLGDGEPPPAGANGAWTRLGYLGCACEDGTHYEGCADYAHGDPEPACAEICAGHGKAVGQSEGPPPNYYCRAPSMAGPDLLTCRCEDGHEQTFCADLWCTAEEQRLHLCDPLCEEHGGTAGTECDEVVHEVCAAPGPNLVVCACDDRSEVEICSARDCMESIETNDICDRPCAAGGGGWVSACHEQAARCL